MTAGQFYRIKFSNRTWVYLFIFLTQGFIFTYNALHENLNHDEATQFWIAKGFAPHEIHNAQSKSVGEVFRQNITHNLDPGGFSIFLHYWLTISNHIFWLKLPSFLFFAVGLYHLLSSIELLTNNLLVVLVGAIVLLFSNNFLYNNMLVRPYSLEYAGAFFILHQCLRYRLKFSRRYIYILAILCAVFLWSRYTFSVNIIALLVLIAIFRPFNIRNLSRSLPIVSISIVSLVIIYFFVLREQAPSIQAPKAYHNVLLKTNRDIGYFLYWNFLDLRGISYTILLGIWTLSKSKVCRLLNSDRLDIFMYWTLIIHAMLLIYSVIGASPWFIRAPQSTYLILNNIIAIPILFSLVVKNAPIQKFGLWITFSLALIFVSYTKLGYVLSMNKPIIDNSSERLYIDAWEYPEISYLIIYGGLKNDSVSKQNRLKFLTFDQIHRGQYQFPLLISDTRFMGLPIKPGQTITTYTSGQDCATYPRIKYNIITKN